MARLCAVIRVTARTLLLIFVGLLAVVSGLQISHYDASTRTNSSPDQSARYTPATPIAAIAIDLGNTNSCVAGYAVPGTGNTETMFQHCIPSWVAFSDDGAALVGEAARSHAEAHPEAAFSGFKRLLGLRRDNEDEEGVVQKLMERVPYKIGARNVIRPSIQVQATGGEVRDLDVEVVASMVVAELKKMAEGHLGPSVSWRPDAVVTVPQHFHGASARAAMDAGKIAGLDVVRMVSEPVAAAAAYGLGGRLREGGSALVLHVGGGTAEASVLTLIDGSLEIVATREDPFLGGDDFDRRVVDHFVELIKAKHGKDISDDRVALIKLGVACERAKKALSSQDHAQVSVESLFSGVDFSESLSREKFEELNGDLFGDVIALVERVMSEAELERGKDEIDEIVLVGGSTNVPKIQRLIKDYFGGKKLDVRVKPDEAVAIGAAAHVHSSD
ncbi:unnamed protein product [Urochloa humidicola]